MINFESFMESEFEIISVIKEFRVFVEKDVVSGFSVISVILNGFNS